MKPFKDISRRVVDIVSHPTYHRLPGPGSFCNICRRTTVFICDHARDRWIRKCLWCRSTPKYRALLHTVEKTVGQGFAEMLQAGKTVYELTTTSAIYRCHHRHPNYVCSGYFSDRPFHTRLAGNVWNEDVQNLGFANGSFDVVVSSETMEHVRKPWKGFSEIHRVLKRGGVHCFTIPYHSDRKCTARVDTAGPEDVYLMPKIYHLDPYRPEDSLVYTDFGADLPDLLSDIGFDTRQHMVWDPRSDIQDDLSPVRVFVSVKS